MAVEVTSSKQHAPPPSGSHGEGAVGGSKVARKSYQLPSKLYSTPASAAPAMASAQATTATRDLFSTPYAPSTTTMAPSDGSLTESPNNRHVRNPMLNSTRPLYKTATSEQSLPPFLATTYGQSFQQTDRVLGERMVEYTIRVPKKVLIEEIIEKTVIIPESRIREETVEVATNVRDRIIEIAKPVIQEKIVEVPQIEYQERIVEHVEVIQQEKIREVPKIEYQERIVEVPKIEFQEKIVPVPEVQYRDVPVERVEEVVEIREEIVVKERAVPRYVTKPVMEEVTVEEYHDIGRVKPIPVEALLVYDFKLPQIKPHWKTFNVPLYVPRFVELPVPAESLDAQAIAAVESYAAQVTNVCSQSNVSLTQMDGLLQTKPVDVDNLISTKTPDSLVAAAIAYGTMRVVGTSAAPFLPLSTVASGLTTLTPTGATNLSGVHYPTTTLTSSYPHTTTTATTDGRYTVNAAPSVVYQSYVVPSAPQSVGGLPMNSTQTVPPSKSHDDEAHRGATKKSRRERKSKTKGKASKL